MTVQTIIALIVHRRHHYSRNTH